MEQSDLILGASLKFVTLANEALKRAGEAGQADFDPTMLKVFMEVKSRGNTYVLDYRASFGPFMVHHGYASIDTLLDALEEVIETYGLDP